MLQLGQISVRVLFLHETDVYIIGILCTTTIAEIITPYTIHNTPDNFIMNCMRSEFFLRTETYV